MSELISQKYGNFDYIIVGAGTSGCLLANRLSADLKIEFFYSKPGVRMTISGLGSRSATFLQ